MAAENTAGKLFQTGSVAVFPISNSRRGPQAGIDRRRYNLNMAAFFGCYIGDQRIVRANGFTVTHCERLISVIHQGGHFAEAPAQEFLNILGSNRIDFGEAGSSTGSLSMRRNIRFPLFKSFNNVDLRRIPETPRLLELPSGEVRVQQSNRSVRNSIAT